MSQLRKFYDNSHKSLKFNVFYGIFISSGEMKMQDRLAAVIDRVRSHKMSPEELAEQRFAFAYGNAPHGLNTTKEEVRELLNATTAISEVLNA